MEIGQIFEEKYSGNCYIVARIEEYIIHIVSIDGQKALSTAIWAFNLAFKQIGSII
jgi:hypothetical protein